MKRILLLCLAVFGLTMCTLALPVNPETATTIAARYMGTHDLQLTATYRMDNGIAAFYVFNTSDGFVIVAADDCETPIIGYSHEGCFDPNNVPVQMEYYLKEFVSRIQYGIENHIEADELTAKQWELVKSTGRPTNRKDAKAVEPLLTSKWHQGCLYNSLCPEMQGPCNHAEAGCVAVAMAQIMHYWGYPETGWGSHSYTNAGVTFSADFGSTTYDWEHMPDSLTENSSATEIEAVATLLYHCGVSVDMKYTNNGSMANSTDVPDALIRYFSYSKRLHQEKRSDYSHEEWLLMLKNCLDLHQPVHYTGYGAQGGHAFVCDGYDDNDLLHFNWGWGVANGYFALGNLNPLGYEFNNTNSAILDIFPQYEPCLVLAMANPSSAGSIEGTGEYHIGDSCTLTATSAEDYRFFVWKIGGKVVSNEPTYTFIVKDDIVNLEANFSLYRVGEITASYSPDANNPSSPNVSLSWNSADTEWTLLKQFETEEEGSGVETDGQHIYVTSAYWDNPSFSFGKYSMDGELIERFNVEGITAVTGLGYDGNDFYCTSGDTGLSILYRVDLYNKTVIDSVDMGLWFGGITYDPEYDGFWLGRNYNAVLYNRQGQRIKSSPAEPEFLNGTGYYTAKDGSHHLLQTEASGIYDYDIDNDVSLHYPLLDPGWDYTYGLGACVRRYDGKEALYIPVDHAIRIYEIKSQLEQIVNYRIYRADSEGHAVMLADGVGSSSFTDTTWDSLSGGEYRFGISEMYANGVESEIIWSDPIVKSGHGINENNEEPNMQPVRKVFENGQIIIIKDGKRYTVTGQQLN